jgi:RNA polymerase sigma-70 factor (ECF subfamily)
MRRIPSAVGGSLSVPQATPQAIAAVYTSHGAMAVRRARAILGDEEEARDIAHEVFVGLLTRPEQFGGRSALSTFIYAATTNLALRRLRDRNRRAQLRDLHVAPARRDARHGPVGENLAVLRDVLRRVPEDLATVAVHVYIDEMSHDEIADVIGCSRRTVGNLLVRFHEKVAAITKSTAGSEAAPVLEERP